MKKRFLALLTIALVLTTLAAPAGAARADSTQPPGNTEQAKVDPNSPWAALIDQDGNLLPNVKDLGEVQVDNASWFPDTSNTLSGKLADLWSKIASGRPYKAEFHAYQAPGGQVLLMPTAQTAFFMAANPEASGITQASEQGQVVNKLYGGLEEITGLIAGAFAGKDGAAELLASKASGAILSFFDHFSINTLSGINARAGVATDLSTGQLLASIASNLPELLRSGQTDWGWAPFFTQNNWHFVNDLVNFDKQIGDVNWGNTLLAYNSCEDSPIASTGACQSPSQVTTCEGPNCGNPPPLHPSCSAPSFDPGAIHFTAEKVSPNYPLVVGQDPQKVGVTVHYHLTIEPTLYHTWVYEQVGTKKVQDPQCLADNPNDPNACPVTEEPEMQCVEHTQPYREQVGQIVPKLTLDTHSRDWILTGGLSAVYPGNYLRHPDWNFVSDLWGQAQQSFQGNTFVWDYTARNVQINDPGLWHITLFGGTSGIPEIKAPARYLPTAPENGGDFRVAVFESSIIQ